MSAFARGLALLVAGLLGGSCGRGESDAPPVEVPPSRDALVVHLGAAVDGAGEGSVVVDAPAGADRRLEIELDGAARIVEIAIAGATGTIDGEPRPSTWLRPRPVLVPRVTLALVGDAAARITVWARGAPVPKVRRERSLVWTDPALVDDRTVVGLGTVMAAAADDGHGGVMLDRWFRRFATTAHSERTAPASFAAEIATGQGSDPRAWKLDALPFTVSGVHNRLDLATRETCGELRVSLASTHPIFAPMHILFLYAQQAGADDRAPDGALHCLGTARRWARLSLHDGPAFLDLARKLLAETIRHDHFLLAETVELTVSPWEWRQWTRVAPDVLDNPPLFQTVDVDSLNVPGARRNDFLAFVTSNADALDARTMEIPDRFRSASSRVPPGAPRSVLDIAGLPSDVAAKHPDLRRHIEVVGCPTCHTEHAEFVQTSRERVFSPFYDAELDARARRLDVMSATGDVPARRFGPLQD